MCDARATAGRGGIASLKDCAVATSASASAAERRMSLVKRMGELDRGGSEEKADFSDLDLAARRVACPSDINFYATRRSN